jgi:hypothetical protein
MPRKREPTRRALIRFMRDSFLPELPEEKQDRYSARDIVSTSRKRCALTSVSGHSGQSPGASTKRIGDERRVGLNPGTGAKRKKGLARTPMPTGTAMLVSASESSSSSSSSSSSEPESEPERRAADGAGISRGALREGREA